MPFDKSQYDMEYARENITRKFLAFNKNDPADVAILEHLRNIPRGTMNEYIKQLIRDDMKRQETGGKI